MRQCSLLQDTVDYDDAAEMLGCSRNQVRKLMQAGELPYTKHAGKIRFYVEGIEAYCQRQRDEAFQRAGQAT